MEYNLNIIHIFIIMRRAVRNKKRKKVQKKTFIVKITNIMMY